MTSSGVQVGAATDTGPTYTVTINRDPSDTITDLTAATGVVLVLPDATTQTVSKTSATASQWIGTIRYNAWFTAARLFKTVARVTFPGSPPTVITVATDLNFTVIR